MIATTLHGLENVLAQELDNLGAKGIKIGKRAVEFDGTKELMYRCNYELRTALRILRHIRDFRVRNEDELYECIQLIDWSKYMTVHNTLMVESVVNSDYFNHSQYVSFKVKDAIVDQFRDKFDSRPSVNKVNPTLQIHIFIEGDRCSVSLDSSGEPLFKREYRQQAVEAPLNEVLAAGMILLTGWKKDCPLIDGMCGSGTIPIEAAMYACNMPPQMHRKSFGFMRWRDFDADLWSKVRDFANRKIKPFAHPIIASDISPKAFRISQINAEMAGVDKYVQVERKPFDKLTAPSDRGLIILNPPYDDRLKMDDALAFYKEIGNNLKKNFIGHTAWILSGNLEAMKFIGLQSKQKITLFNGQLECKFNSYEMYEGSLEKEVVKEEVL